MPCLPPFQVSSVDCSPSNSLRAVSSGTDRCIKVWDLNKGFCVRTIICHSSCNSVRCTRDEHIICSGHFDGTLRFWDIRSGKMANEVTGLHTQQICSIQVGIRNGVFSSSAVVHTCPLMRVFTNVSSDSVGQGRAKQGRTGQGSWQVPWPVLSCFALPCPALQCPALPPSVPLRQTLLYNLFPLALPLHGYGQFSRAQHCCKQRRTKLTHMKNRAHVYLCITPRGTLGAV